MRQSGQNPTRASEPLAQVYQEALGQLVRGEGDEALNRVHELGRRAAMDGLSLVEIANAHHAALEVSLENVESAEARRSIRAAALALLIECLTPMETATRSCKDSVSALRHFNLALEEQAQRVAHSIHDGAGQMLVAVHLALADLQLDLPAYGSRIEKLTTQLQQIQSDLREVAHQLRPTMLDHLGLAAALEFLGRTTAKAAKMQVDVEVPSDIRPAARCKTLIYRIVEEALNNVATHSRAARATVTVRKEGNVLHCRVHDDGVGFDPAAARASNRGALGLLGMAERARAVGGTFEIQSAPGSGTDLRFTVPLEDQNERTRVSS